MRFICRVGRWAYMLTAQGQLYHTPLITGEVGYPIDPDIAANSCWRHAEEYQQAGKHAQAAQYRQAARALDKLVTAEPVAA